MQLIKKLLPHPNRNLMAVVLVNCDQVISRLRTYEKYRRVFTRTKRYCSFIQYTLNQLSERYIKLLEHGRSTTCRFT